VSALHERVGARSG